MPVTVRVPKTAYQVADSPGQGQRGGPPARPRPPRGEAGGAQRPSRLQSGGQVTISSELADAVARGEVTLDGAIQRQRRRDRRSED